MSYLWFLTKSFSKKLTGSSDLYTSTNFNTLSTEDRDKRKFNKSKSVTFGEIQVMEVESYKKYNELDEINFEVEEIGCMKKCGIYCKCDII